MAGRSKCYRLALPPEVADPLEALAKRSKVRKGAIIAEALTVWFNHRGSNELDERFALRLDRMTRALHRLERDQTVLLETLALFIRYELSIHAPLAENDAAGRAVARGRFDAFVTQVGRQVAAGRRSMQPDMDDAP